MVNIFGPLFFSILFENLALKSQFRVRPIKEILIGTLPKLMLAARQEIKKTYTFLCVVLFSN